MAEVRAPGSHANVGKVKSMYRELKSVVSGGRKTRGEIPHKSQQRRVPGAMSPNSVTGSREVWRARTQSTL